MNKLEQKRAIRESLDAPSAEPSTTSDFAEQLRARATRATAARLVTALTPAEAAPTSKLDFKRALASTEWMKDARYAEVNRIRDLDFCPGLDPETHPTELEDFNAQHVLAGAYEDGFRLYPTQVNGLIAYKTTGGLLAPIGVGWGKTLLSLMIAQHAYEEEQIKFIVLCVPPQVVAQLMMDIKWARTRVRFTVPVHSFYKQSQAKRRQMAAARWPGLYIMPYSLFSARDTADILELLCPGLIIADEAHYFARRTAARTKRLMHFLKDVNDDCRLATMSGTITSKTIKDYYHLARRALGEFNPLPNDEHQANDWATLLDSRAPTGQSAGPLLPLCQWAARHFPDENITETREGFRRAYRLRLNSSPGVVASGDEEIGTSLVFHNETIKLADSGRPGATELQDLIDRVIDEWTTPNGDEIEHAIHTWKWLNELTVGFYNELIWPTPDAYAARKGITVEQATEQLEGAKEHHTAHQEYARLLRDFLQYHHTPGLDTPFLVGGHFAHHRGGHGPLDKVFKKVADLYPAWCRMKDMEFDGMPERDARAVRVCDYKLERAVEYAKKCAADGEGAILWIYHQEVGQWLFEMCNEAGLDTMYCPAGENDRIIDPANAQKIVVASMTAHGVGKNLQHFSNQYFVQWPRDPKAAEQTIGRTHRNGQQADEIIVWTNASSIFDHMNRAACINDALYIHQTTGNRQKLIYGTYDPVPVIFPPEVLREKGLDAKALSMEQRRLIEAKFGEYAA